MSGCREATSGLVGWLSSVVGDVSSSISDVGLGTTGTDRKSGVDLRSVGRRRRTSVDDVGRRCWVSAIDVGHRCRVSTIDVGRRCRVSVVDVGCRRRKSAPGKYFRYGLVTQDLVSHDVHGLITAIRMAILAVFYTFSERMAWA